MLLVVALGAYNLSYIGRVFQGVSCGGVDLSGLSRSEAETLLERVYSRSLPDRISLSAGKKTYSIDPTTLDAALAIDSVLDEALSIGREGPVTERARLQFLAVAIGIGLRPPGIVLDITRLEKEIERIGDEVDLAPINAELQKADTRMIVTKEQLGQKIDRERSKRLVIASLYRAPSESIKLPIVDDPPEVTFEMLQPVLVKAEKMVSQPVSLQHDGRSWSLTPAQLATMLTVAPKVQGGGEDDPTKLAISQKELGRAIGPAIGELSIEPEDARFEYVSAGKLKLISEGKNGRAVDLEKTASALLGALERGESKAALVLSARPPEIGPDDGGKLGIKEVIESASTDYNTGSAERRFNVELAARRLNGYVVPPGEEFSFNDAVGEVSYRSGYKRGYGIVQDEEGQIYTIPSEGGGICQVATTLFHSVFWSGMTIVERHWHVYWIPRYGIGPKGMKGLDATIDQIYDTDGSLKAAVDFRFKNATDSNLIIGAKTDGQKLTISLSGVKPDWKVKVDEPKIEKVVQSDETPVNRTDASLAPGARQKIEEARDGFQATIIRRIVKGDQEIERRVFVSIYRPSRNVYINGPQPGATPTQKPTRQSP